MDSTRHLTLADDVTLTYRHWRAPDNPQRRTLVLLHGLASNHTRWAEFTEQTALKQTWDILRPDLRGHGESPTRGKIGLEIWCDDLLRLLDVVGTDRAVIAGHSLGAQVACLFAARHPARVLGLALLDPVHPPALIGRLGLVRRLVWLLRLVVGIVRLLNRVGFRRRHFPLRDLRVLDESMRVILATSGDARQIVLHYTAPRDDLRYIPLAHYLQELVEITRPLPPPEVIPAPTRILLSKGIAFVDTAAMRDWASRFPAGETQSVAAYHWPLTERPIEVRVAIERFCAERTAQRA